MLAAITWTHALAPTQKRELTPGLTNDAEALNQFCSDPCLSHTTSRPIVVTIVLTAVIAFAVTLVTLL
jgi:hypothetical protein